MDQKKVFWFTSSYNIINSKEEGSYVLNERSYRSFSRKIPFPENIVPTKVDAIVENGILRIELPKQRPKSIEETKIKIK